MAIGTTAAAAVAPMSAQMASPRVPQPQVQQTAGTFGVRNFPRDTITRKPPQLEGDESAQPAGRIVETPPPKSLHLRGRPTTAVGNLMDMEASSGATVAAIQEPATCKGRGDRNNVNTTRETFESLGFHKGGKSGQSTHRADFLDPASVDDGRLEGPAAARQNQPRTQHSSKQASKRTPSRTAAEVDAEGERLRKVEERERQQQVAQLWNPGPPPPRLLGPGGGHFDNLKMIRAEAATMPAWSGDAWIDQAQSAPSGSARSSRPGSQAGRTLVAAAAAGGVPAAKTVVARGALPGMRRGSPREWVLEELRSRAAEHAVKQNLDEQVYEQHVRRDEARQENLRMRQRIDEEVAQWRSDEAADQAFDRAWRRSEAAQPEAVKQVPRGLLARRAATQRRAAARRQAQAVGAGEAGRAASTDAVRRLEKPLICGSRGFPGAGTQCAQKAKKMAQLHGEQMVELAATAQERISARKTERDEDVAHGAAWTASLDAFAAKRHSSREARLLQQVGGPSRRVEDRRSSDAKVEEQRIDAQREVLLKARLDQLLEESAHRRSEQVASNVVNGELTEYHAEVASMEAKKDRLYRALGERVDKASRAHDLHEAEIKKRKELAYRKVLLEAIEQRKLQQGKRPASSAR
eukprot:TRINITY_DN11466_c0_g1_i1.p1 TRINITY_DN11466_c0_g1~~TRINITY_DN11466_c0_g1_i1.p1  ORF type:complete len:662 (+),score=149.05 TRINITY_DN11466_c0_g1_i1:81-1988(+)